MELTVEAAEGRLAFLENTRFSGKGSARADGFGDTPDEPDPAFYVLVVEDEPATLEAVAELLEAEKVGVLRAQNGREAFDLLEGGARPALILLDLRMPVMDGWEFCRRIAAEPELARIPVAIVSASASVAAPARAHDAGMFVKPVDYSRLLALVERYRS
jgi:CheY-like chemotaxis protein